MRLLMIDAASAARAIAASLRRIDRRYDIRHVTRLKSAMRQIAADSSFEAALVNLTLPDAELLEAPRRLCAGHPELVVVALTHDPDPGIALDVIRVGAQDVLPTRLVTPLHIDRVLRCAIERHRRETHLMGAAFHDDLTGALNRRGIRKALSSALGYVPGRKPRPCALLTLDLDNFKAVNDRLGHPAGDALLRLCYQRILGCVRSHDHVGRMGGDEFCVLLEPVKNGAVISSIADKIIAVFESPFQLGKHQAHMSVSIGMSQFPRDAGSADSLVAASDNSLYEAKRRGKRQYVAFREIAGSIDLCPA